MLSKSEKILMTLNSKQSHFAHWQPQSSFPTRQGNSKKMTKAPLGLIP